MCPLLPALFPPPCSPADRRAVVIRVSIEMIKTLVDRALARNERREREGRG